MKRWPEPSAGLVVFVLALALAIATVVFAVTVTIEVVDHEFISEVPPNSSQVLIAIFSGIIGIIGSYVGYRHGRNEKRPPDDRDDDD